jgi:hypothetical protein
MKYVLVLLAGMALLPTLMGCEQDPLKGQPDHIRNAVPPDEKDGDLRKGVAPDTMTLVTEPRLVSFVEGEEATIKFVGEVKDPENGIDKTIRYRIDDLDFILPGATFDSKTGELTWTPNANFVSGGKLNQRQTITVHMTAGRVQKTKEFPIYIARNLEAPEILSVRWSGSTTVGESERRTLTVQVRDMDSTDARSLDSFPPTLSAVKSVSGRLDASPYLSIGNANQSGSNPNVWTYTVTLNVDNDVTKSQDTMRFAFIASSRFGVDSVPRAVDFRVISSPQLPNLTWEGETKFAKGVRNILQFDVYSDNKEGRALVNMQTSAASLPGNAKIGCAHPKDGFGRDIVEIQKCLIDYTPSALAPAEVKIKFEVISQSTFNTNIQRRGVVERTIQLVDASSPVSTGER